MAETATKRKNQDPITGIPGDHKVHHDRVYTTNEVPYMWDIILMGIPKIHAMGITGKGVNIGAMDTGFTPHPLLPKPQKIYNFTNNGQRNDVTDRQGHGNWINGKLVGQNGVGVAPGANLFIAKVLGDDGSGRTDWSREGRVWLAKQGVHVNSVSIGGPTPPGTAVYDSMREANELGTLVECAAGGNAGHRNPGQVTTDSPGNSKASLGTGSFDRDEDASDFTSAGPAIDLIGPGGQTISTSHRGFGFSTQSGTSMATPFIAGLIALTIDKHRQMGIPDSEMNGVEAYWRPFVRKMAEGGFNKDGGEKGKDNIYGYGTPMILEWVKYLGDYKAI